MLTLLAYVVPILENTGYMPDNVVFYTLGSPRILILNDGSVLAEGTRLRFGDPKATLPEGEMPGKVRFMLPDRRPETARTFKSVRLREAYPGVDVLLTPMEGGLEVQFFVEAGADPSAIEVLSDHPIGRAEGVLRAGNLKIGNLRAFQGEIEVEVKAEVSGNSLRFSVGEYDPSHTLVIDPIVAVAMGGMGDEEIKAVKVQPDGNVVVAGHVTYSPSIFPSTHTYGPVGGSDIFIFRLSAGLDTLLSAAVVGSKRYDAMGRGGMVVDPSGNVVVVGETWDGNSFSSSRTVLGSVGMSDAFVIKLTPDLSSQIGAAVLGSGAEDVAVAVAVDSLGRILVGGETRDYTTFAPSRTVFGTTGGGTEAFVSLLTADLTGHLSTVILAGTSEDIVNALGVDVTGNVLAVGRTWNSSNFTPSRVYHGTAGGTDAFVVLLDGGLTTHIQTAIISGSGWDYAMDVAINPLGGVVVAGWSTYGAAVAPSRVLFGTYGHYDAFVTLLSEDLLTHVNTAVISGDSLDYALGVDVDSSGNVVVVGETYDGLSFSSSRRIHGVPGMRSAFVTTLSDDLNLHLGTAILSSAFNDAAYDVDVVGSAIYIAGSSDRSSDLPVTDTFGAANTYDGFVSLLEIGTNDVLALALIGGVGSDIAKVVRRTPNGDVLVGGRGLLGPGMHGLFVSMYDSTLTSYLGGVFFGSLGYDAITDMAVAPSGEVYVLGYTKDHSTFSPSGGTVGPLGGYDAFVCKFSADLSTNLGAILLGGRGAEFGYSLEVVGSRVYVVGETDTAQLFLSAPVLGTLGKQDIFVASLDADLTSLLGMVYLAGSDVDMARAADYAGGKLYITGATYSSDFSPSRTTLGTPGGAEVFVSKLDTSLTFGRTVLLAGSSADYGNGMVVSGDKVYVVGTTSSGDFAPTRQTFGTGGSYDIFVSLLDTNLTTHLHTSVLASPENDIGTSMDVLSDGVVIGGLTADPTNFSTGRTVYGTTGEWDAILSFLSSDLTTHIKSVVMASPSRDAFLSVEGESANLAYAAGYTCDPQNFATGTTFYGTPGACDALLVGFWDVFTSVRERDVSAGISLLRSGLRITLDRPSYVGFSIYDGAGRLVERRSLGFLTKGSHSVAWKLPIGTYTLVLRVGDRTIRRKIIVR